MKKGLFALALGTFTLGIAEFIIEGILTDVAHNMGVSIPQAGHLISIYALGVCAGAFSLIFMHKYRPRNILLFLSSLIVLGSAIATISPNYGLLLCARFVQGLPHGAFFGTGAIVAVKIADKGKGTKAVAMMCAGMPFANLIGVPLGTFLSHIISWRMPFAMSTVMALVTLYMIYRWVPDVEALPNNGMKAQFRFMRSPAPWLIIAATFLGNGGILCWFSYISPLLQVNGGFSAASISLLMILAGLGMVVGNQVSAFVADRIQPGRFTFYLQLIAALALLATFFLSSNGYISAILMFGICACLFGIGSPEQYLIVKHSEGGEMLGGCCIQAAFNLGISLLMILAGLGMVVGNQVSAFVADRIQPGRFTFYLQLIAALALLATFFLSSNGYISAILMFGICACLFGIGSPEQYLIVKHSEGGEMLGGCCIQAAFNLGNALGAFLGGIPVSIGLGYNYPALIGVPMALVGAICLLIFHKKYE